MTAGLPNNIRKATLFVLTSTLLLFLVLPALAEDVQPSSTTLDDVINLITQNEYISPEQQTLLTFSLTSAVTSGAISTDQALALVSLSRLENVADTTETPVLTHALSIILYAMASGEIDPEQASTYMVDTVASGTLSALKDLIENETPAGIQNSISNLAESEGYEQEAIDTVLAKVDELVAAGVPSGIALRVVKDLLRAGLDPNQIVAELDRFESSIAEDGSSPGKAANEVTSQGQNQNQEEEMNQNTNQGENDKPENENEENQNGSSGNGKSSDSPGNGSIDNSGNGSSGSGNGSGNSGTAAAKGGKG